jgi:hypothetical protein
MQMAGLTEHKSDWAFVVVVGVVAGLGAVVTLTLDRQQ